MISINKNDLNAINFREELIKLLKKYDCEISGTHIDDGGNMNLSFNSGGLNDYIVQGDSNKYNIIKVTLEEKWENVMDNYIVNCFSDNSNKMSGLNNIKVRTGIFTNNELKAESKIMEIYNNTPKNMVHQLVNSRDIKELRLVNGSSYIWIKPSHNSRGYKCANAIIDRRVTLEELHNYILPICVYYCGKNNVSVF